MRASPTPLKPLVVSFADFCDMIGVRATKGYQILNSGEVESYLDGSSRMVVVASIERYVERRRAEATASPALPKKIVKSLRRSEEAAQQQKARRAVVQRAGL